MSNETDVAELMNYATEANQELSEVLRFLHAEQSGIERDEELAKHVSWLKVYVDHMHDELVDDE